MLTDIQSLQIVSIISVISSGLVFLTFLFFKGMRKKLFMQIITIISVSDLIGNISYTMTYRPNNGNWWCSLQGFCNMFFYPVSWMWTTMLMYFLYSLAVSGKLPLSRKFIHLICW